MKIGHCATASSFILEKGSRIIMTSLSPLMKFVFIFVHLFIFLFVINLFMTSSFCKNNHCYLQLSVETAGIFFQLLSLFLSGGIPLTGLYILRYLQILIKCSKLSSQPLTRPLHAFTDYKIIVHSVPSSIKMIRNTVATKILVQKYPWNSYTRNFFL